MAVCLTDTRHVGCALRWKTGSNYKLEYKNTNNDLALYAIESDRIARRAKQQRYYLVGHTSTLMYYWCARVVGYIVDSVISVDNSRK
jgi:hypothetical protein